MLEILALLGWVGCLVAAVCYWRLRQQPPQIVYVTPVARTSKRAQLFNADGRVDSVRTIEGDPPEQIVCAAGTYRLDRTTLSDHWVYRR